VCGIERSSLEVSKAKVEMSPWPAFIDTRIAMWDKLVAKHKEELAAKVSSLHNSLDSLFDLSRLVRSRSPCRTVA
jgi:hypothetical protein